MIRFHPFHILLLAGGFVIAAASAAEAKATDWVGDARVAVRLITGSDSVDGSVPIEAGLEFRYGPGWHGYWRTPGDAGIAPVFDWSSSQNLQIPSVAWPAPIRLVVSGLQNSVYEGRFILPVRVKLTDANAAARIAVSIDYAACANICVPEHADLTLGLPVGQGRLSAEAPAIAAAIAALPGTPAAAGIEILRSSIEPAAFGTRLVVELRSKTMPFKSPDLFLEGAGDGLPPAPTVQLADDGRTATLTAPLPAARQPASPLIVTVVDGQRSAEFSVPPVAPMPEGGNEDAGLIAILASALLGGLILNLMPCVLPILSIKLFGLARHAGGERRAVRLGFVVTALGILACFLVLATALVGLKLSGATLGWGIQFQQPWFLAAMAVLTVLFAASFFEWLPIGLPRALAGLSGTPSRGALIEAFFTGAFSTVLATPCSAPFVGTAVGFALIRGPGEIFAVFLCLGLGMALPFLAAALFPGIVAWLPRPGSWMLRLRQGLGLLLLGTAAWLLWVLWSVAGPTAGVAIAVLLATLLAFRAWVTHLRSREERSWPGVVTAALATAVVVTALLPLSGSAGRAGEQDGWQAFDPDTLDHLVGDGKTVLVDVTARWCLTCKVNDATALNTAEVRARLARSGTIHMRADWSRPDPTITAYLQSFARFGIPLDVVYGPRRPRGEALPELLTAKTVIEALSRADAAPTAAASALGEKS